MDLHKFLRKKSSQLEPVTDYAQYFASAGVKLSGELQARYDIFIDGDFEGSIKTSGFLEFGKNSKIKADIQARSCIIEGEFNGNAIIKEDLLIISCAQVRGSINANNLSIEKGARLNSKIKTTSSSEENKR